jgi:hypothetical protein
LPWTAVSPASDGTFDISHWSRPLRVELERWEERLRESQVTFTPIAETPIGSVIVFRDPDNIQLEFWLPVG